MAVRLTAIDDFQLLTCLKHQVWGSHTARFKTWKPGDHLVVIVNKSLAGLVTVTGPPFFSKQPVWDNGLYPHRIPVKFLHLIPKEHRPPLLGEVRDALTSAWGPKYGFGILNQQALPDAAGKVILQAIQASQNALGDVQMNLDYHLTEAQTQRDSTPRKGKKNQPQKTPRLSTPTKVDVLPKDPVGSKTEEALHAQTQSSLIQLAKIAGCSAWIASNDRGKLYRGQSLGAGCLKSLPNLGLAKEARDRIARIDVIWFQGNAPQCAFEVEVSTSIYSGLLRMSDLLALVPALKLDLFIVAPAARRDAVMRELARPTFHKIGLSEFCKFLAVEKLAGLIQKVELFQGHVQASIVHTIAEALPPEVPDSLV